MTLTIQKPQPIRTGQLVIIPVETEGFDWKIYRVIGLNMELAFLEPCTEQGIAIKGRATRRVVTDLLEVVA